MSVPAHQPELPPAVEGPHAYVDRPHAYVDQPRHPRQHSHLPTPGTVPRPGGTTVLEPTPRRTGPRRGGRGPRDVRPRPGHIPGLDGLRAIAVVAVLFFHFLPATLPGGFLGVDVFFVVSGFLITTLLLREVDSRGRVDLLNFWRRRARRLLPALVLVVISSVSVARLVGGDLLVGIGRQTLGALTFTSNWLEIAVGASYFHSTSPILFVNFWSLAVEEQFYLFWPLVLVVALALTRTTRQRVRAVAGVAVASTVLMAVLYTPGEDATRVYYGTDTHLFGLMIGVALAFTWAAPRSWLHSEGWQRWRVPAGVLALVGLGWLMTVLSSQTAVTFRGGILAASALTAVVLAALLGPVSPLRRLMQLRPLEWVGQRSYGIYLWHWPVILILTEALPATTYDSALRWTTRLLALLVTLVVAAASYRWLEQPIRRLGFGAAARAGALRLRRYRPWLPRAVAGVVVALLVTTGMAVATAPSTSQTQQQTEAGQDIITRTGAAAEAAEAPVEVSWDMPSGAEITGFGDSIMVTSAHGLTDRWPEIALDAESNRQWADGLAAVERAVAAGTVRRAVVLDFGTNAGVGQPELVRATLDALGPDRMVVVVNLYGGSYWIPEANAALEAVVADYPNVVIADWYGAIDAEPEMLQSDGIHPDIAGGHLYTDVVAGAFAELAERQGGDPSDPAERAVEEDAAEDSAEAGGADGAAARAEDEEAGAADAGSSGTTGPGTDG